MNYRMLVGLGNPGKEYEKNRHNVGFIFQDRLAAVWRCPLSVEGKFRAEFGKVSRGEHQWLMVKPLTFMNASGESVAKIANFYKVATSEILAIYDDLDLPLGGLRLKPDGSSGGHNGMKSLEAHLGTKSFPRLRVGIGRDQRGRDETVRYVLSDFTVSEMDLLDRVLDRAMDQVDEWGKSSLEKAMSLYNGRIKRNDPV
jgi:peptidyl-tRNA hydrolase, PTH1 family